MDQPLSIILPLLKDQPFSIIVLTQIIMDWALAHATDTGSTAVDLCTIPYLATVSVAYKRAIADSIFVACSACHRSHAFAVLPYAFDVSYEALAEMPLRDDVQALALDNVEQLHELLELHCPVSDIITTAQVCAVM